MRFVAALSLLGALLGASCAQPDRAPSGSASLAQGLVALSGEGELVETERLPTHSVMQVLRAPSGSVPSALYALRGACAVLRARGAAYVASERMPSVPGSYRLTFPVSPAPDSLRGATKTVFTAGDCAALRF